MVISEYVKKWTLSLVVFVMYPWLLTELWYQLNEQSETLVCRPRLTNNVTSMETTELDL